VKKAPASAPTSAKVETKVETPTTSSPTPSPQNDCNPPYYFSGQKKIFKPQCI